MNKVTHRLQRLGNNSSNAATTTVKRIEKRGNGGESRQQEQVEKALRESEEKYRNLFEYARDMIVLVDTETGKILDINTAGCNLLGLPKEKIIGKHQTELHPPELAEKHRQLFQDHIQRGGHVNDYVVVRGADGAQIPTEISASVMKLADKTIIQGIFRDVTERASMEKALRESEEKFSKAFQASPEAMGIITEKDGRFIDVNDSYTQMTGYSREELLGNTTSSINIWLTPEDKEKINKILQKKGRVHKEETDYITKSGEIRTRLLSLERITINGEPCRIGVSVDITERKKMEKALRESEEKFSKAFHASPEAIAIISAKDERYIDINDSYTKIFGYSREELIGNKAFVYNWANPEDHIKIHKMMKEQGRIYNEEFDYRTKSGEIRTRLLSLEPITINGEPCRIGFSTDITKRKRVEQALKESEEKFSKAFRALPEQVTIVRMKDDVFVDVNESFCRYNGYTREEVIGYKRGELNLLIGPSQRDQLRKMVKERDRFKNIELECREKSGETRTLLFSADIINIGGEPCQLTIANDITERKRMEKALKESEEKFSKAFQSSPDAVSLITVKDERYIDINDSYLKMTGYSREELKNNTAFSINLWVNDENHTKMHKMMQEQGRIYNEEYDYRTKSGEIRTRLFSLEPITINGEPCTLGVSTDITERKKVEQALKESEEKFSKAFQAIPEVVTLVRMKDGVFIDVNETFCRNNGYTREEVIGRKGEELNLPIKPGEWDKVRKMVKERGRAENVELEFRDKSGELHTMLFSTDIINLGGEPCLLTIGNDITERKRIEQALRESEEKFSKAFQAMPEEVTIVRMKDSVFIDVNETFCRNNGYTREEVIGRKGEELNLLIRPGDWDHVIKMVKKQGRADNIELEFRDKAGETHTLLFSSDIISLGNEPCILTIANDISQRKQMENALKESEEKFSKAFLASPEAMGIVREKDGRFLDVNDSYTQMTGFSREELLSNTTQTDSWVSPEDKNKINKILQEKGRIHNEEIEYRTKSGEIRIRLLSLEPITINSEPCRIGVSTDITERKRMEKKLKEALADLESSSAKLKATNKELESFSYSVSHDLRSPLRSIDGFSQALLEDYSAKLDEKGQDYLNRMRNASQKMGELIDGLLKLSRLTRSEMHHEKVDLTSLANEITARFQEIHDKRDVKFIIGDDLTTIGDPQMLRVLLENLLGNAWKFTKNTKQAFIEFGSTADGERKTFFIKDNGAGFDMTFKDKLFGAFQRLHDAAEYPGTGIGLATVQRIINRHGGSIRAEGEVGKGATFYFTLS